MPKPPQPPVKKPAKEAQPKLPGMVGQPGKLYVWTCPVCGRDHHGFSRKVCRNELCELFGREASR